MIKSIKFFDVEIEGTVASFQVHMRDINNELLTTMSFKGNNLTAYIRVLLAIAYKKDVGENSFQTYCSKMKYSGNSSILIEYYVNDDFDEPKAYQVVFNRNGIICEIETYERVHPANSYDTLLGKSKSIEYIRNSIQVFDVNNDRMLALMRANMQTHKRMDDYEAFKADVFEQCGYYDGDDPLELTELSVITMLMYPLFVRGGILIIDNIHALSQSNDAYGIVEIFERGLGDRNRAQLITGSLTGAQLSKYYFSKTNWLVHASKL